MKGKEWHTHGAIHHDPAQRCHPPRFNGVNTSCTAASGPAEKLRPSANGQVSHADPGSVANVGAISSSSGTNSRRVERVRECAHTQELLSSVGKSLWASTKDSVKHRAAQNYETATHLKPAASWLRRVLLVQDRWKYLGCCSATWLTQVGPRLLHYQTSLDECRRFWPPSHSGFASGSEALVIRRVLVWTWRAG